MVLLYKIKKEKKTAEATQQPYPTARIGLREFVELIESLDNTKLDAVRDMGFGELIKLKALQSLNLKVLELMCRFDENSSILDVHGERLVLTEVEVSRILGLPVGGVDIQSIKCSVAKMNTKYGLKLGGIIRKDLVKELKTSSVDDKWKARLILFVSDSILKPTSSYTVNHEALKAMGMLNNFVTINWCSYVLQGLKMGVKHLKSQLENSKNGELTKRVHLYGCILLLEVFYLEYLKNGLLLPPLVERALPRISVWDDSNRKQVFSWVNNNGGFDSSRILVEKQLLDVPTYSRTNTFEAQMEEKVEAFDRKMERVTNILEIIVEQLQGMPKKDTKEGISFDDAFTNNDDGNNEDDEINFSESETNCEVKDPFVLDNEIPLNVPVQCEKHFATYKSDNQVVVPVQFERNFATYKSDNKGEHPIDKENEALVEVSPNVEKNDNQTTREQKYPTMQHPKLEKMTDLKKGKSKKRSITGVRKKIGKKSKESRLNAQYKIESAECSVGSDIPIIDFLIDREKEVYDFILHSNGIHDFGKHVFSNRTYHAEKVELHCLAQLEKINSSVINIVANVLTEEEIAKKQGQKSWFLLVYFANKVFMDEKGGGLIYLGCSKDFTLQSVGWVNFNMCIIEMSRAWDEGVLGMQIGEVKKLKDSFALIWVHSTTSVLLPRLHK